MLAPGMDPSFRVIILAVFAAARAHAGAGDDVTTVAASIVAVELDLLSDFVLASIKAIVYGDGAGVDLVGAVHVERFKQKRVCGSVCADGQSAATSGSKNARESAGLRERECLLAHTRWGREWV